MIGLSGPVQPAAGPTFATDTPAASAARGEGEGASEPDAAPAPATAKGSGWGTFFIGLGAGFALFLAFFVVAGVLMKKRSKGGGKFNRTT